MTPAIHMRPIAGLAADVAAGRVRAADVTRSAMTAVVNGESGPERLNAFISFDYEGALAQATDVDTAVAGGSALPLAGVPVAVKDNICVTGLPTTCGSRILADYWSPYDATVARRLRAAGAVLVGKTNMDEFGMGSSTENSALGPTRNPHDPTRVPGGSSGGSAAAVAAGLVPVALGSETGGSVRQPAAFCGIVGIKPSYGRVSRYGLVAYASSLDQVGVFGRTVRDAALLLRVISGPDPLDATCADVDSPDFAAAADGFPSTGLPDRTRTAGAGPLASIVVGVPDEYFPPGLDAGVRRACDHALDRLRALGATLRRVSLPHTRHAVPAYYVIATAEASSNLARFDGVRYGARARQASSTLDVYRLSRSGGFGGEVKRRIMLGTFALSAGYHDEYYGTAQRVRTLIARDFEAVFGAGVDVLFTPTTPTAAFRLGEKTADPYEMYLSDVFTVTANLAALPALSLPIGSADGMPVGGQLMSPRWAEATMIATAAALETELSS
ncbi:MAG TPA: Asp-tRNA(Asn)/Glu-tRNA(Gln) amidotransferase subunit GatA [Longimicrobiales bacterium]|nr:Asp-tRNA(Asn)/Glu-tRNA(Gln) amidotransferase subunit GatA [Longimicrobiales bacterium]